MPSVSPRLFRTISLVSLGFCLAACVTWAGSYRSAWTTEILPRGAWRVMPWRGQLVVVHPHLTPGYWVRRSWGTTTVYLSADPSNGELNELTKAIVYDPAAPWDDRNRPAFVAARPYLLGRLATGCRFDNAGGFDFQVQSLPANIASSRKIGPVLESLTVPIWLLVATTAAAPLYRLFDLIRRSRTSCSLCVVCAYNLAANASGVCPECGTLIAAGANR
jgi:hypothetical protein